MSASDETHAVSVDPLICRDYAYAWRAGWRWIGWYLRQRRIVAALRTVWYTLALGHIGEACQECGRPYLLWWADDALYAEVTGRGRCSNGEASPGLYCLECFDRKAFARGITLRWKPTRSDAPSSSVIAQDAPDCNTVSAGVASRTDARSSEPPSSSESERNTA